MSTVPKYFFNVTDGIKERDDDEGAELLNEASALQMAKEIAADLAKEGTYDGFSILLRDELGNELCRVPVTIRH